MGADMLIIEDETLLAANLAKTLARHSITSDVANSLAEAQRLLGANTYRLVCADIQLGDGNGLSFCEGLRERNPDLPVIMMTGQDTSGNRLRAEGFGAMAFMAKPFPLSRFRELVGTLLREDIGRTAGDAARRGLRVLMYSHDTIGLGHMRRNSAIAARIVEKNPDASVLMLVGSPAGVVFELPPGVDYIKLPSLAKVARNVWRPHALRISNEAALSLRADLIDRTIESFSPDVVLVDHEPGGVWNELVPALSKLRATRPQARAILGLRDILDEPDSTRASWEARGTAETISRLYDDIIVYGDERFFATRDAYQLDGLVSGDVHYCGYVTAVNNAGHANTAINTVRVHPNVVVAGGGGRDAYGLLAAAVEALTSMPQHIRPDADIIAGPLMDGELREPLKVAAQKAGLRFHDSHPDIPALLRNTDLFVTMAGYNSVIEAMATGCRTLIVPRVGPSAEQRIRAGRLAELGLAETLAQPDVTAGRLAAIFAKLSNQQVRPVCFLSLAGAEKAADFIAAERTDRPQVIAGQERLSQHA